ncbi:MAG: ABC transporter permease [Spirochaetales bacterium]|nr:ABC transporter permease [Spirochaetales bacterium]MCF7937763.1 ABC transporter permease [Spirochaetales bacterium]
MIHTTVEIMAPFLLAALGGLFTERAGVLNIGLEGLMLFGAFSAFAAAGLTGSLAAGLTAAVIAGLLLAGLIAVTHLKGGANIFIAGLAANLLAVGMTSILSSLIFGTRGVVRLQTLPETTVVHIGFLEHVPVVGPILNGHSILVYASWGCVALVWYLFYRTRFGLRVRAVGESPETALIRGVLPGPYRLAALLLSGVFAGAAGAVLMFKLGAYVPNISAGRGWIALVAIYLGRKHPVGILGAAALFAAAEVLADNLQGIISIPATAVLSLPYLITVVFLVLQSALSSRKQI